jgi:hypothetical protein
MRRKWLHSIDRAVPRSTSNLRGPSRNERHRNTKRRRDFFGTEEVISLAIVDTVEAFSSELQELLIVGSNLRQQNLEPQI